MLYNFSRRFIERIEIDDPLQIFSTHYLTAAWSLIARGLFDKETGLVTTGNTDLVGVQLLSIVAITGWAIMISVLFFFILNLYGGLRVSMVEEMIGRDLVEYGVQG